MWMIVQHKVLCFDIDSNYYDHFDFIHKSISVVADALAPNGARASAASEMAKIRLKYQVRW